ncbi:MAG: DUF881 domain-containing protein [Acidothermaceae bacterium]
MSLLVDLMTNAIDQGYLDAAKRRSESAGEPAAARRRSARTTAAMVAAVLALAGALFATAAVATHRGAAAAKRGRDHLVQQIHQQTALGDQLQEQLSDLQLQVKHARDAAFSASGKGDSLRNEISQLEAATGTAAAEGPGAVVTLDDAKNAGAGSTSADSLGTIYDRDIQAVVDALFANGAEAIAVNGQRLTTRTAIREAGDAILVDYRPLAPPYVVAAVGPPDLADKFLASQTGTLYQNWKQVYGLGFTVEGSGRLTLPSAADQVVHYAQPLESP